jgi:acetylornithine/succinyldiaminopimelate/putrescine aminotransferase
MPSQWSKHAAETGGSLPAEQDAYRAVDARRCTVQLSTGRLYLDAVASPATALLGHDRPPMSATDELAVKRLLSSLVPGYVCLATAQSFDAAADLAERLGRSAAHFDGSMAQINAHEGEPAPGNGLLVVRENETLGRTGHWLASRAWSRIPDLVVVGDALALGWPFGAVLAQRRFARLVAGASSEPAQTDGSSCSAWLQGTEAATPAALERVAAVIAAVESERLLEHGREVATYLMTRLATMRASCPQLEHVDGSGLCVHIAFARPLRATQIRRRMCERGVLTGVDTAERLVIDPPLAVRIAEIDVITGALRSSIVGLPLVNASACCAACRQQD